MRAIQRIFWPILYILAPLPAVLIYFQDSWYALSDPYSLAALFGLCGYTWLLLQFVNSSRIVYFDRLYGLDSVIAFHSRMAMLAIITVIIHSRLRDQAHLEEDLQIRLGKLALILFLIITLVTLLFMTARPFGMMGAVKRLRRWLLSRLKIQYQHFLIVHNLMAAAMLLALLHVVLASSTQTSIYQLAFIIGWYAIAFIFWLNHKFIRPLRNRARAFTIASITHETKDVITISLNRHPRRSFHHRSGQFAYFRFLDRDIGWEEHPLTISSAPHSEMITITARQLGDWTKRLDNAVVGDRVAVDGPFGNFSLAKLPRATHTRPCDVIMIAGGIGITPFLSMLEDAARKPDPTRAFHLLWAVKDKSDLFAADRIMDIERRLPNSTYSPIIGRAINTDSLWSIIKDKGIERIDAARFFMCGPPPMMRIVQKMLREKGISPSSLYYESFAL